MVNKIQAAAVCNQRKIKNKKFLIRSGAAGGRF